MPQMVRSKRWLLAGLVAAAAMALAAHRRRDLGRLVENLRRYSAPSATLYDIVTAPLLDRYLTQVTRDLADLVPAPKARVLEVGSGPGRLAATLAQTAANVRVTGVDIAPDRLGAMEEAVMFPNVSGGDRYVAGTEEP